MELYPSAQIPLIATCLFTHGQGDYAERYLDVLHPFTQRGIKCIVTDLQGHGRSTGKRGHIDSPDFIDSIIESNFLANEGLPTGIAGHSMGGLLTLRHLALALEEKLPLPTFCWVNGPLLRPANGRPDWFVRLAHLLANVSPRVTIHTGVTPDMCRLEDSSAGRLPKDPLSLGHRRVSLGWGSELIRISNYTHEVLTSHPYPNPFLFTQGGADSVCPPSIAKTFFSQLQWPQKQYNEFDGMLHETFAEAKRNELFLTIGNWLDQQVLSNQ
ncbi:alpha/beta fold hydrolase [Rubritalea tangerina]|uniref:Alpha/beta fold hydrolase n=2 Tax=Rubritalea tangerina TaxID=430798 RepID=A0ABW4ZCM3_9BACT